MKTNKITKYFIIVLNLILLICFSINTNHTFCLQTYTGEIEHLNINGILSFPSVLSENNYLTKELESKYITPSEFKKILASLNANNYILIKLSDCYEQTSNGIVKKNIILPKGKKPVILSINDVEYGKSGMVNKLIIQEDNTISSYTSKRSINDRIHNDKEFITILNEFVTKHPGFSHNNAKGLICVSGSNGILGYKTQKSNANSKFQIKNCIEVVNALKDTGWEFCAKSYNKQSLSSSNLDYASALNTWNNNVKNIIGSTNCFYLDDSLADKTEIDYKCELLLNNNFNLILNSSFENSFEFDTNFNNNALVMNVKKISGETLKSHRSSFLNMFDSEILYDRLNRNISF